MSAHAKVCRLLAPADDPHLEACFVEPPILSALLRQQSTIVAARAGYGKSTLAYVAQRVLATDCLNVTLSVPASPHSPAQVDTSTHWDRLIRAVVEGAWARVEAKPTLLGQLVARAPAFKYFANKHFGPNLLDLNLERLAEDFPSEAEAIHAFQAVPHAEYFGPHSYLDQKLSVLCDAVSKLGALGVVVWVDLPIQHSAQELDFLFELFDSVSQMRAKMLHIKCLVDVQLATRLEHARGVRTVSAERLDIAWTTEKLIELANRRLRAQTSNPEAALQHWIDPQTAHQFLADYSDAGSPSEWTALTYVLSSFIGAGQNRPMTDDEWVAAQRIYCAERVKIRMDSEGVFWRGTQRLSALTKRKGKIYPLVKYLYENPGYHQPYRLESTLKMNSGTLDTTLSRARNAHIEPHLREGKQTNADWIYLVTSAKSEGIALIHTDRTP